MTREHVWKDIGYGRSAATGAPSDLITVQADMYEEFGGAFDAISMLPVEAWWPKVYPDFLASLSQEIADAMERIYIGAGLIASAQRIWDKHYPYRSDRSLLFIRLGIAQTILASWERALDLICRCIDIASASRRYPAGQKIAGYRQSRALIKAWLDECKVGNINFSGTNEEFKNLQKAASFLHGESASGPYPPGLDNLFFGHSDRHGMNVAYDELRDGRDAFAHAKDLAAGALGKMHPEQMIETNCTIVGKLLCFLTCQTATGVIDPAWSLAAHKRLTSCTM